MARRALTRIFAAEYQKELAAYYVAALRYGGNVELLDFSFASEEAGRSATVKVARMKLPCDDGTTLWFVGSLSHNEASYSIGADHSHQYVAISDADDLALCEMVASTYHFDRFLEVLDYGHTFPLGPRSALRTRGYSAGLILGADLYEHFKDDESLILGIPTRLFSVVPITRSELEKKKIKGLDTLLEAWNASGRDFLHIAV